MRLRLPLFLMPVGIHVAGSKPWFCRKKITRFGPPELPGEPMEAARAMLGNMDEPKVAPKPEASICRDLLRFIIVCSIY